MMRHLIIIRHSETQRVPGVNAHDWTLTEAGHQRSLLLAEQLRRFALQVIVSSPEPKALQTAQPIATHLAIPLVTAAGLREHDRHNVPYVGDALTFQQTIQRLFTYPEQLIYGNESADQAHTRFAHAIDQIVADYPAGDVALVTHATVLTLYVARRAAIDPFSFWSALGMPAYVVFDLPTWSLREVIAAVV